MPVSYLLLFVRYIIKIGKKGTNVWLFIDAMIFLIENPMESYKNS